MLKREELAVIDRAIAELGRDSYLGPWLASVRYDIEQTITSDFMPTASILDVQAREQRNIKRMDELDARAANLAAAERACDMRERGIVAREAALEHQKREARKALAYL